MATETEYYDAGHAANHGSLSATGQNAPPVARDVTYERILDASSEPENWLTYYGTYDGQRYSRLDQINPENVKRRAPAWVFQAGPAGRRGGEPPRALGAGP